MHIIESFLVDTYLPYSETSSISKKWAVLSKKHGRPPFIFFYYQEILTQHTIAFDLIYSVALFLPLSRNMEKIWICPLTI